MILAGHCRSVTESRQQLWGPAMTYQSLMWLCLSASLFGSSIVIMAFDAWLQPPGKTQTAHVLPSHKCLRIRWFVFFICQFLFLLDCVFFSVIFFFFYYSFLYMLNVIDKTQMLPVSANRINHLLQNGEKYLHNFFHPELRLDSRSIWSLGSWFYHAWIFRSDVTIPWQQNNNRGEVCSHFSFDVGSWHKR